MKTKLRKKIAGSPIAAAAIACLLSVTAGGQTTPPPATPAGLDAMVKANEPKVLTELVNDGLETLLHRQFDVDNTPDTQRQGIEALGAMRILNTNPNLSDRKKLYYAQLAAEGLQLALNSLPHDSATLEQYARTLIAAAETRYETTLEYWGETPITQANLKPIADITVVLYKLASDSAEAECNTAAAANHLDAARALDGQSQFDTYLATLLEYDRGLAIDATTAEGKAQRTQICGQAVSDLQQYDDPTTTVQPVVEMNMGKNLMIEGKTADAIKKFDNLIKGNVTPAATPDQVNDAYYFKTAASVLAGDPAAARKSMDAMKGYQQTLPDLLAQAHWKPADVTNFMASIDTENQLLLYRIGMADAAVEKDPKAKDKKTAEAAQVLQDLAKKRPELQGPIFEQLVNCLPQNQPVTTMEPLLLQAVMHKGISENAKPAAQRDKTVLQRGLEAAKEVLARKDIDPDLALEAARVAPAFDVSLGNTLDAANAYLDFAEKYKTTHENEADPMLHRAYGMLEDARSTDPTQPGLSEAYQRFYQLAVTAPFNYTRFYYAYGHMLDGQKNYEAAAKLLKQVPANDDQYAPAQWELLGVYSKLVDEPTTKPDAHKALVNETAQVADEIRTRLAHATDLVQRYHAAFATETVARIAINDQNDPKTALDLMSNYEGAIAGLNKLNSGPKAPDIEKALLVPALFIRYRGHMATKQNDAATADLLQIMSNAPGDQGAQMVHDQLDDLHKQFEKAQAAGNKDQMRDLARNQGKLSSVLADWARDNKDPVNRKAYYYYGVSEANDMRIAGSLEDDPAAKDQDMKEALAKYQFFASDKGHAMYLDQLDPAKKAAENFDATLPDANVELGLALTQYELHNYLDAQKILSSLLANGQVGNTSADSYWEATFKLYSCNYELAKAGNADAQKNLDKTKAGIKALYIFGGIPPQWQSDFDALRMKLIPEWKVPETGTNPQQSVSSK